MRLIENKIKKIARPFIENSLAMCSSLILGLEIIQSQDIEHGV